MYISLSVACICSFFFYPDAIAESLHRLRIGLSCKNVRAWSKRPVSVECTGEEPEKVLTVIPPHEMPLPPKACVFGRAHLQNLFDL